jgi:hypothetical protein
MAEDLQEALMQKWIGGDVREKRGDDPNDDIFTPLSGDHGVEAVFLSMQYQYHSADVPAYAIAVAVAVAFAYAVPYL